MPKILLVEDNDMNRDMLSRRLIKRGYEVVVAVDGQEGVDHAREIKPDLVIMDMSLPVKDGWVATAELKADPATQSIRAEGGSGDAVDSDNRAQRACDVRRPRQGAQGRLR